MFTYVKTEKNENVVWWDTWQDTATIVELQSSKHRCHRGWRKIKVIGTNYGRRLSNSVFIRAADDDAVIDSLRCNYNFLHLFR